ncbi:hypothetical protein NIES4071_90370 [Calothrix sp. NIES-4071]|nr:hypothetical protein NIES4071_90370 [Calothrix sp. NIES-4071]BAZ63304.1 hypothetical protein NIES4105_90300 [Calothrix sp. NIES-4105]
MKNQLIIKDLSYLQQTHGSNLVIAGNAFAETATFTATGTGYALAGATGLAMGQLTYTNAQTQAKVIYCSGFTVSTADALATAYASSGSQIASSSTLNTSTSFSFNSSSNFKTSIGS